MLLTTVSWDVVAADLAVDDMEEPLSEEEDESESETDIEEEEAEKDKISPEAAAGEDDGVAAGVSDGGKLPPVTDEETDEFVEKLDKLTTGLPMLWLVFLLRNSIMYCIGIELLSRGGESRSQLIS